MLALKDLDSIVAAFNTFLFSSLAVFLVFLFLVVFSTGSLAETTVTAGTFLFAFSFTFADTFKNVFVSYVFLFVRQPYDVGDRVIIGTKTSTPMYVRKMELLTTTFRQWDGLETTLPNYNLANMQIFNIRRSVTLADEMFFRVDIDTSEECIEKLQQEYKAFLESQPNNFDAVNSDMAIYELEDSRCLKIFFYTAHRTNFQNAEHIARRHDLCLALKVSQYSYSISLYRGSLGL